MKRFLIIIMSLAAFSAGYAGPASATDTYPAHPIELICSTSPGSTAAQWCQMIAQVLSHKDELGVQVNVTFKGGGSGNQAGVYVDGKPADGYTLLHANASWAGYMNLPTFQPSPADFQFVARIEKFIYAIGVNANTPYKTFADLVAAAKKNPGSIAVAGNKIGSIHQKEILTLFKAAGVKIAYIPYKGSGDAVRDVLGGHVPVGLGSVGQLLPYVKDKTIRPLVVLNEDRVSAMPDVPTAKELGYDYPIAHQWQGIFVKTGTPDAVKQKLRTALAKVVKSPEYAKYLKNSPHVERDFEDDPKTLSKFFADSLKSYKQFMKKNGLL